MLCRSQQVVNMMLMCFENDVVPVTASCELDVDVYVVVPVTTTSSTEATRMYDIVQHVVPVTTTNCQDMSKSKIGNRNYSDVVQNSSVQKDNPRQQGPTFHKRIFSRNFPNIRVVSGSGPPYWRSWNDESHLDAGKRTYLGA